MKHTLTSLTIAVLTLASPIAATASDSPTSAIATQEAPSGDFVKKRYNIKGDWSVEMQDGKQVIVFSEDFKTRNGPDLKVFLSPKPVEELTGKTALQGAVSIGVLKANKGSQSYSLPDGVDLSAFESVIIHCEAYSVLWGGFDIPE